MKYEAKKYINDFQRYEMIIYFGDSIYTRDVNLVYAEEDPSNLSKDVVEFNNKSRIRLKGCKEKKQILMRMYMLFMRVEN